MSHHWFERGRVYLHPREVILERLSYGIRGRRVHRRILSGEPGAHAQTWELPLELLRSALSAESMQGLRIEVVLSGHFVRYALVPWSEELPGRQERMAYLRHCFVTAYGEAARGWDLRMCEPYPDESALASGVDPALLEALRQVLEEFSCEARGIHPYLMQAANRSRAHAPRENLWLAVAETDRICLSHIAQGTWKSIRQHVLLPDAHEPLFVQFENLLARESMLCGDLEQEWPVMLHWPISEIVPPLPGRQVVRVPTIAGETARGDEGYRQALWA